jgi:hypothetical protein
MRRLERWEGQQVSAEEFDRLPGAWARDFGMGDAG